MPYGFLLMRNTLVSMLLLASLLACSSKAPAPVESRSPSRAVPAAAESAATAELAAPRAGYHVVKKGDTLYSIANQYGRNYRELAAWNGLGDTYVIKLGQELRVQPQGDAAPSTGVVAIAPVAVIDSKPIVSSAVISTATSSVASGSAAPVGLKTEPKGGRVPYSAQAWKDLTQAADKTPVATVSVPVAQSAPAQSKSASSAAATPAGEDLTWVWPGPGKVLLSFKDSGSKGVDLAGNVGDPVLAANDGQVIYVGSALRGYGNLVIVRHDKNFQSVYAHNSKILVKEGQSVKKSQQIALLGNSDSDTPKLHFEIRRQGSPVDPMKFLPPR